MSPTQQRYVGSTAFRSTYAPIPAPLRSAQHTLPSPLRYDVRSLPRLRRLILGFGAGFAAVGCKSRTKTLLRTTEGGEES